MLISYIYIFTGDIKSKSTILGLLYHACMDDKVKAMFVNIDCIPMVKVYKFLERFMFVIHVCIIHNIYFF